MQFDLLDASQILDDALANGGIILLVHHVGTGREILRIGEPSIEHLGCPLLSLQPFFEFG